MADKEPAGSSLEPTPADDRVDPAATAATPEDGDRFGEPTSMREPTNEELAALTEPTDLTDDDDDADEVDQNGNGAGGNAGDNAGDGDREPVSVGAAAAGRKRGGATARSETESEGKLEKAGKGRATRKRDTKEPAKKRTGPVTFVRESVGELRKVVYPTGQQLVNYFVVVLIFVLFIIAYVSLLDLGFGWAMFQVFA